jgi:2-keto-3-deoxy-L-rhamnonate aldolase RhmA
MWGAPPYRRISEGLKVGNVAEDRILLLKHIVAAYRFPPMQARGVAAFATQSRFALHQAARINMQRRRVWQL